MSRFNLAKACIMMAIAAEQFSPTFDYRYENYGKNPIPKDYSKRKKAKKRKKKRKK